MYKLSILIPTHNRPVLFQRALRSALKNKPNSVEIICNNDSFDMYTRQDGEDGTYHEQLGGKECNITYHYNKFGNLSGVYKFLLFEAKGEYVYFLEDDDYIKDDFYDIITNIIGQYDIISGNYYPTYNTAILKSHENGVYTDKSAYVKSINFEHLQLSKFVFRRSCITSYTFKEDSNVHNDIDLFLHAVINGDNFINIPNVLYFQTVDGKDNISFEEFNKNIERNEDFYEDYKKLWN